MDSTLAKGLAALEWMVRQQRGCRVTELAQAFGMARSNAHRTLQTLVECGWAVQDPETSAYRPSLRLFELGAMVSEASDIGSLLRPHLARLSQATGETIHLAVLDGAEIVYLDKFDSPLPVAAYSRIGGRAAAYCVASGKALLAAAGLGVPALQECRRTPGTASPTSTPFSTNWNAPAPAAMQRTARNGASAYAASARPCSMHAARPWRPSA
jgi:IclR family transcriptional regulator, KDG regulon repressor